MGSDKKGWRSFVEKTICTNTFESDWGIGFRFHGPSFTVLRIEAAHSTERTKLVLTSGATF